LDGKKNEERGEEGLGVGGLGVAGGGGGGGGGEFYDLGGGHGRGCRTGDNSGDEIGGRALLDDEIREVSQVVGVAVVLTRQEVDLVITATEGGVA